MFLKTTIMTNMILITMLNHPISLGTMVIIQTTLMCSYQSNLYFTPWFSYVMFMTMIGGMMIMFMYMSSIASNEKFSMNFLIPIAWISFTMIIWLMYSYNNQEMMIEKKFSTLKMEEIKSTMKMFNKPKLYLIIMIMIMLLVTMISVTKISSTFEGPLKTSYV